MHLPGYSIRQAALSDAAALADLAVRTFAAAYPTLTPAQVAAYAADVYTPARLAQELADPETLFLLLCEDDQDERLHGYLHLGPTEPPAGMTWDRPVELVRLYLEPEAQGHRLGARLLASGLDWAGARGYRACWLRVWDQNPRAVAFYEREGFEAVGAEPYQVGGLNDRVMLMRKDLPAPPRSNAAG